MFVLSLTVSAISNGIRWNLRQNARNVYYKRILAIKMQIFAVSEVWSGSYCNLSANCGTKTDAAKLFLIW